MKSMNIHISGRRWFQRTYGNTYNSVTIYRNGEQIAYLPRSYGYGEYYLQRAIEWLGDNGYPRFAEKHDNGCSAIGTAELRDMGVSWSVSDVARQRDL